MQRPQTAFARNALYEKCPGHRLRRVGVEAGAGAALPEETFGSALRRLREAAGWTQEELAERAGLTSHGISALERGLRSRPYPHTVRALAAALGLGPVDRAALLAAVPSRGRATGGDSPDRPVVAPVALPAAPTPLVGRDGDVAALLDLLDDGGSRLLTLTGIGGVGKTRLAQAVALAAAERFPGGVAVVPLAAVEDAGLILPALGRALGLHAVEGSSDDSVLEGLRGRRALVVLDNLEHLADAGLVVARLLEGAPSVVVLATSRAALRVRGEREYAVAPLALPSGAGGMAEVEAAAAGALFLDRARAVSPGFATSPDDAPVVALLCERVAGIPLALELAAARARVLSPRLLLERLDDALGREGAADLPERQRTMRSTLDWSYRLLGEQEQALYRRLSVFVSGACLDAVEDVAADLPDVLGALERLAGHSLVTVSALPDGTPRYGMLEPVLQHAAALLDDREGSVAGERHAEHYLDFARRAAPHYEGGDQVRWLERSEQEQGNLVAALEWWLRDGDGERAGAMVWSLWLFWWLRGHLRTGRRLAESALELPCPDATRVRSALAAASLTFAQGDLDTSAARWTSARELAHAIGDRLGHAGAEAGQGLAALGKGHLDAAETHFRNVLDDMETYAVEFDWLRELTRVWLGTVHLLRGRPDEAVVQCELGLGGARRRSDRLTTYVALYGLVQAALARADHETAQDLLAEGIELSEQTGDLANLSFFLESLAVVDGAGGRYERAVTLLGASTALRERVGSAVYGYYLPDPALREATEREARIALGRDVVESAFYRGRSMTPEEALALAGPDAPERSVARRRARA